MQPKPTTQEEYRRRINWLVEYVNDHLGEEIDLNGLASLAGFSPWHFHRIIRAYLGEPLGAFIVRLRLEAAARWLRYTRWPVQEIAYRVGYDVPSSLSKVFKQFYGISPSVYRKDKTFTIMKPVELNAALDIRAELKAMNPLPVAYIRLQGYYPELDYFGAWTRLFGYLRAHGMSHCPDYICIYYDDPKVTPADKLRTDVCLSLPVASAMSVVPVSDSPASPETSASVPAPAGEVGIKEITGGRYAVFTYRGPYSNLGAAYDTIYLKYLPELDCRLRDSPGYERYLNNPAATPAEELLTQICIPVE